jgi:hypothetical protein
MAFNITTNYVGQDAQVYVSKALLTGDTLAKELVTTLPGVKKSTTLHTLDIDSVVQAANCDFTAQGDVIMDVKTLTPADMMVNLEVCKNDLKQAWISAQMTAGALNTNIPSDLADFILDYISGKVAASIDNQIWQNLTGAAFTGYIQKMVLDAAVIDVPFVAVTKANVLAQLEAVNNAVPATICDDPDLIWAISKDVAKFYKQAVAAVAPESYSVGAIPLDYQGNTLTVIKGLPAGSIVVFKKENLFFGTDLLSDFMEAQVIDMQATLGSRNVRVIMAFSADVNFAWGEEIVLHQGLI